jgi:glycosyl transferase, family 25
MRAYVINLPSSSRRRQLMEDQLHHTGLLYEFVAAVDGKRLPAAERATLIDEQQVARAPGWLSPGAIGCTLSHWHVYRRIAEHDDDVALVLEDDAVLSSELGGLTARAASHVRNREVVLLYFRSHKPCLLSDQDAVSLGQHRLLYPMDPHQLLASTAYLITRDAARSLAETMIPVRAASDSWGHYYESGALDSVRCVVRHAVGARTSLESTLGYGDHYPLRRRLRRRTLWPLPQLRALNRWRIEERMTRITMVSAESPVAQALKRSNPSTSDV